MNDVEEIITYLTGVRGLKAKDLEDAVGLGRSGFLSWRRSTKAERRRQLAEKLIELFPAHFQDGQMMRRPSIGIEGIEGKYIAALESEKERLLQENAELKTVTNAMLSEILTILKPKS